MLPFLGTGPNPFVPSARRPTDEGVTREEFGGQGWQVTRMGSEDPPVQTKGLPMLFDVPFPPEYRGEENSGRGGYRTQWLGPETAGFLRGLEAIPPEVKAVIPNVEPAPAGGRRVTVTLNGKPLPLGDQAYLDPTRGRVMVPLRAMVEALGGKVIWSRLDPDFMETAPQHNYGLPPTAGTVDSYVET